MDQKQSSGQINGFQVAMLTLIVVTAVLVAIWAMLEKKKAGEQAETESLEKPPIIATPHREPPLPPEKPKPVADYNKLEEPEYKELMRERKTEYGLDRGIDMIVKADESVRVGDKTIPMREILDKIRIKKGDVIEKSLKTGMNPSNPESERKQMIEESEKGEKRFEEVRKYLESPSSVRNDEKYREFVREYKATEKTVADYRAYKDAGTEIEALKLLRGKDEQAVKTKTNADIAKLEAEKDKLGKELEQRLASGKKPQPLPERIKAAEKRFEELQKRLSDPNAYQSSEKDRQEYSELLRTLRIADEYRQTMKKIDTGKELSKEEGNVKDAIEARIRHLELWKNSLENDLRVQIMPQKDIRVYGVYVVRPGDNVWNIHFAFLKDYFQNRGVKLSPRADQPIRKKSSGVGRILKFAENMVYIYNLREGQVDTNLNQIHPLSKIVVFNLGEVFSVLSQIDYRNINRIEYDGETLWVPAVQ